MIDIKIDVIGAEYPSLFLQVILPLTLENIPYRFSYDFNFQTDANILIIERGIPHRMSDYCYLTDVFNYCNQHNIKVIYALDDDMYTGDYGYSFKWMALSSMARWLSKHSDIVLATTNQIKEKALKYNKNVVVIENSLYPGFLNYQYKGNKTKLTIGYIGTKTHDKDLKLVVEVLKHLKQK